MKLIEKRPSWKIYSVTWQNGYLTGRLTYLPEFNRLNFDSLKGKSLQGREVYIGKVIERLQRVANGKSENFDFADDKFKQKDNISYLIAPGFEE